MPDDATACMTDEGDQLRVMASAVTRQSGGCQWAMKPWQFATVAAHDDDPSGPQPALHRCE